MKAIAIDGPAGAGKSTIAKKISKKLGYIYVDTGAMYRAIGLHLLNKEVAPDDEEGIISELQYANIELKYMDGVQEIYLNHERITDKIRTEQVGNMASSISVYAPVRSKLVEMQRQIAAAHDVVMDGRDIGTCVLPDADTKIYLTAAVDTRAERRYKELTDKGVDCDIALITKDIEARDYRDMHREQSPLKKAQDAVEVDSSHMSIDEVVDKIIRIANKEG